MITNKEITEFIADKVLSSQDVDAYCQSNFSKSLMVFVGVDVSNPPDISDLPCLIVEPTVKNNSDNVQTHTYEIVMSLGILGDEKPVTNGNKVVYEGVYKVEELGNLIADTIRTEFSLHTNMDVNDVMFYQDEVNAFPVYGGVVVANMNVPNTIGSDKIEFNC